MQCFHIPLRNTYVTVCVINWLEHAACGGRYMVFRRPLWLFYEWFRKVCPQCNSNTIVHAIDGVLLLGSPRTQWNVEKPYCLRKSYYLETKSAKWVRELLKHVSRLCTGKNRTKRVISINTYMYTGPFLRFFEWAWVRGYLCSCQLKLTAVAIFTW